MATLAGVGMNRELADSYRAGYEAGKIAVKKMGGETPDFTFTFSSAAFDQNEVVRGVRDGTENAPGIGCSTAGEITNEGPGIKSVAVMAVKSDTVHFVSGLGKDVRAGTREAGRAVAQEVKNKAVDSLKTFIMLPDVLTGNGADTVRGVLDVLGANFPVVGGAAGDDFLFKKTYQYRDGEVMSGAVVGAGLSGTFSFGIGMRHGWVPIGPAMRVTKAEGAVVYEIDGRPAISIYEDYFGTKADQLKQEPLAQMAITYPLGIKMPDFDEYLIRDPLTVDDQGAITCAAEIPKGSEIRLMIGNKEKAIEAAQDAARHMMKEFETDKTKPKFILIFNCIAREKLFGQKAKQEIDAVMDIVGSDIPLLGFYTYGEQAPLGGEIRNPNRVRSAFYNETIVILGVGE